MILADEAGFAPKDHWALGTGHWALGTGHWALGTGRRLTLTLLMNSFPLIDSRVAPGMHGAIDSTTSGVSQAISTSAETVNEFSKSTGSPKFNPTI